MVDSATKPSHPGVEMKELFEFPATNWVRAHTPIPSNTPGKLPGLPASSSEMNALSTVSRLDFTVWIMEVLQFVLRVNS